MYELAGMGIATCYKLDGPGIESWWVARFGYPPKRSWSPPSLLYSRFQLSSPGDKAGRVWSSLAPFSAEVKERVYLYFYNPLCHHGLL